MEVKGGGASEAERARARARSSSIPAGPVAARKEASGIARDLGIWSNNRRTNNKQANNKQVLVALSMSSLV